MTCECCENLGYARELLAGEHHVEPWPMNAEELREEPSIRSIVDEIEEDLCKERARG